MKSSKIICFTRLLCIFTLFFISDVKAKDDIQVKENQIFKNFIQIIFCFIYIFSFILNSIICQRFLKIKANFLENRFLKIFKYTEILNFQEEKKILYDLKNFTGNYAYNISMRNVIFVENFYLNIVNGTFGEFTIINKLFESLLYRLSMSIMANNYFKSTFEATTLEEAEYFSESAKDIYLEYKEKENLKLKSILIINDDSEENNDMKVKFFHFLTNCFLKINSITCEIKKYVQNSNEIEANNFDIENMSMSMTSKLMNELYIHLMTVRDRKLVINEEDLKIVEFIEKILQHLANSLTQKQEFVREYKIYLFF